MNDQNQQEWTVLSILRWTQKFFTSKGIEDPRLDAEVLLGHTLQLSRIQLYTHFSRPLGPEELKEFKSNIKRRVQREPVAYIIGTKQFWSLDFKVDKRVLIPRPDTETLVELARHRARQLAGYPPRKDQEPSLIDIPEGPVELPSQLETHGLYKDDNNDEQQEQTPVLSLQNPAQHTQEKPWKPNQNLLIADIGTGSGAIAIALSKELPFASFIATDISKEALELAQENANNLGTSPSIEFRHGDLLSPLSTHIDALDIIVSNPPYIPSRALQDLMPEVQKHEPRQALTPGETGLEALERIVEQSWKHLKPGGFLICEIGFDQSNSAKNLFEKTSNSWKNVRLIRDRITNHHRLIEAQKP